MFAKLLKHEWKANSRILWILSLGVLGISVLETFLLRFVVSGIENMPEIIMLPIMLFIVGGFFAMLAYSVGVHFLLLARFYKNKFTDEGYLTFTLPVTTHQILLSSLLNYLFWTVISTVVTVFAFSMPILVGTTQNRFINRELIEGFSFVFKVLSSQSEVNGYVTLVLISGVVSVVSSMMLMHAAIAMGAVLAKKHKILAAFGCYYGFSMVLGTVSSVLTVGVGFMQAAHGNMSSIFNIMNTLIVGQMVIYVAVAVAGYFLSHHLMKNKLNLP